MPIPGGVLLIANIRHYKGSCPALGEYKLNIQIYGRNDDTGHAVIVTEGGTNIIAVFQLIYHALGKPPPRVHFFRGGYFPLSHLHEGTGSIVRLHPRIQMPVFEAPPRLEVLVHQGLLQTDHALCLRLGSHRGRHRDDRGARRQKIHLRLGHILRISIDHQLCRPQLALRIALVRHLLRGGARLVVGKTHPHYPILIYPTPPSAD
jgi:hypothetical protein